MFETIVAVLDPIGGHLAINLATAAAAGLAVVGLARLVRAWDHPNGDLVGLAFLASPVVLIAATSTGDFIWAAMFLVWGLPAPPARSQPGRGSAVLVRDRQPHVDSLRRGGFPDRRRVGPDQPAPVRPHVPRGRAAGGVDVRAVLAGLRPHLRVPQLRPGLPGAPEPPRPLPLQELRGGGPGVRRPGGRGGAGVAGIRSSGGAGSPWSASRSSPSSPPRHCSSTSRGGAFTCCPPSWPSCSGSRPRRNHAPLPGRSWPPVSSTGSWRSGRWRRTGPTTAAAHAGADPPAGARSQRHRLPARLHGRGAAHRQRRLGLHAQAPCGPTPGGGDVATAEAGAARPSRRGCAYLRPVSRRSVAPRARWRREAALGDEADRAWYQPASSTRSRSCRSRTRRPTPREPVGQVRGLVQLVDGLDQESVAGVDPAGIARTAVRERRDLGLVEPRSRRAKNATWTPHSVLATATCARAVDDDLALAQGEAELPPQLVGAPGAHRLCHRAVPDQGAEQRDGRHAGRHHRPELVLDAVRVGRLQGDDPCHRRHHHRSPVVSAGLPASWTSGTKWTVAPAAPSSTAIPAPAAAGAGSRGDPAFEWLVLHGAVRGALRLRLAPCSFRVGWARSLAARSPRCVDGSKAICRQSAQRAASRYVRQRRLRPPDASQPSRTGAMVVPNEGGRWALRPYCEREAPIHTVPSPAAFSPGAPTSPTTTSTTSCPRSGCTSPTRPASVRRAATTWCATRASR